VMTAKQNSMEERFAGMDFILETVIWGVMIGKKGLSLKKSNQNCLQMDFCHGLDLMWVYI